MKQQDFRIFKLNRILELEISENTFIPRPYPEQNNDLQKKLHIVFMMNLMKHRLNIKKNGDLITCAEMPVDKWLIGYLLSFGAQVEIIEPAYLKAVLAAQAQEIYKKNKP